MEHLHDLTRQDAPPARAAQQAAAADPAAQQAPEVHQQAQVDTSPGRAVEHI